MDDERAKLMQLLGVIPADTEEQKKEKIVLPTNIKISKGCEELIKMMCAEVREQGGGSFEWASYMIAEEGDGEYITRNLYFPEKVRVQPGFVSVNGAQIGEITSQILEENKGRDNPHYMIGWLHSHAAGSVGFSGTDHQNKQFVMNSVRFNTQRRVFEPMTLSLKGTDQEIKDGVYRITGRNMEDLSLHYDLPDEKALLEFLAKHGFTPKKDAKYDDETFTSELVKILGTTIQQPAITSFCYSVVVNDKHDAPYGLMGSLEERPWGSKKDVKMEKLQLPVHFVDVKDDINPTRDEVRELVEERIIFPPKPKVYAPGQRFGNGQVQQGFGGHNWLAFDGIAGPNNPTGRTYPGKVPPVRQQYFQHQRERHGHPPQRYTPPRRHTKQKVFGEGFGLEEVIQLFTMSAMQYLVTYEHYETRFSEYLDDVLIEMRQQPTLSSAMRFVGHLQEDDDVVTRPQVTIHALSQIGRKLYQFHSRAGDSIETDFMEKFYTAPDKNDVLEHFVPLLRGLGT